MPAWEGKGSKKNATSKRNEVKKDRKEIVILVVRGKQKAKSKVLTHFSFLLSPFSFLLSHFSFLQHEKRSSYNNKLSAVEKRMCDSQLIDIFELITKAYASGNSSNLNIGKGLEAIRKVEVSNSYYG